MNALRATGSPWTNSADEMAYLVFGTIIGLAGVGLMMSQFGLLGIIVTMVGAAVALKGRRTLDK